MSEAATVDEVDVCLRAARAAVGRARVVAATVGDDTLLVRAWRRVDRLLEQRQEFLRRDTEHHVEEWWCGSWPGTLPPDWPDDADETGGAGQGVGESGEGVAA